MADVGLGQPCVYGLSTVTAEGPSLRKESRKLARVSARAGNADLL